MKSCTLLSVPPSARTVTASRWRWLLPLMGLLALGQVASAQFTLITGVNDPLNGVDVGNRSIPVFVDIDNDCDKDLFVGNALGEIMYYKNTGTASAPVFQLQLGTNNPLDGYGVGNNAKPAFVDIDGDGDLDCFVGALDGTIHAYENTGSVTVPVFNERIGPATSGLDGNPFDGEDVGANASPAFFDFDNDGDFDCFVGRSQSTNSIRYFRNEGDMMNPVYAELTGAANPLSNTAVLLGGVGANGDISSNACLTAVNLDNDSDMDIYVGVASGVFRYFRNNGGGTFTHVASGSGPLDAGGTKDISGSGTDYSAPTFVDIDADGDLDCFSGRNPGTFVFYRNTGAVTPPTVSCKTTYIVSLTAVGTLTLDPASVSYNDLFLSTTFPCPAILTYSVSGVGGPFNYTCADADNPAPNNPENFPTQHLVLTATDGVTNATCSISITVEDKTGPVADVSALPDLTRDVCNLTTPTPTATDVCQVGAINGVRTPVVLPSTIGTHILTWTYTDSHGNTSTQAQNFIVVSNAPPTWNNCPGPINTIINTTSPPNPCGYDGTLAPGALWTPIPNPVDCDPPTSGWVVTNSHNPTGFFPVGVTNVSYSAQDASGNVGYCNFTVTVTDGLPPTISGLTDPNYSHVGGSGTVSCLGGTIAAVPTDINQCGGTVTWTGPTYTATDNCGGTVNITQSHTSGTRFPTGPTTVSYVATDAGGTSTTFCSFTITVVDTQDPTITCPSNLTVPTAPNVCTSALINLNYPTYSDNCPTGLTIIENLPVPGGVNPRSMTLPIGPNTFQFTATDAAGRTASCTYAITVVDMQAPTFGSTCPTNQTLAGNINTNCSRLYTWTLPTATDNCPAPATPVVLSGPTYNVVTAGTVAPTGTDHTNTTFNEGTTRVTYTATDGTNTATCSFTVTITNTTPPSIACPGALVTVNPGTGCLYTLAAIAGVSSTATSPCHPGTLSYQSTGGSPYTIGVSTFPLGNHIIVAVATDISGNSTTCSVTISVVDNVGPQLTLSTCPPNMTVNSDATAACGTNVTWNSPVWVDNCSTTIYYNRTTTPVGLTPNTATLLTNNGGGFFPVGTTTVNYVAKDGPAVTANLGTPCGFSVTVVDDDRPSITNCPVSTVMLSTTHPSCNAMYTLLAPTVTDNGCNSSTYTVNFTVSAPSTASGSYAHNAVPPTVTLNQGNNTIAYTTSDAAGNTTSCVVVVEVKDLQGPIINCSLLSQIVVVPTPTPCTGTPLPWDETTVLGAVDCSGPITINAPTVVSTTGIITPVISGTPAARTGTFPIGVTTLQYLVLDNASPANSSTCTFTIDVRENTPPTINCSSTPQSFAAGASCNATITSAMLTSPSAVDNCASTPTVAVLSPAFPQTLTVGGGLLTVTWVATDLFGTTATCTRNIQVTDQTPPVINCGADITVNTASCFGISSGSVTLPAVSATDNCAGSFSATLVTPVPGTYPPGATVLTYEATDGTNTVTCTKQVLIRDNQPPVIVCPSAINVTNPATCPASVPISPQSITDNCVSVNYVSSHPTALFACGTTTVVTLTANDASGNTNTCSVSVTVGTPAGATCTPSLPTLSPAAGQSVNLASLSGITFSPGGCCTTPIIVSIQLVAGPGIPPTIPVPVTPGTYTFATAGTYTAQYTISCATPKGPVSQTESASNITFNRTIVVNTCTGNYSIPNCNSVTTTVTIAANQGTIATPLFGLTGLDCSNAPATVIATPATLSRCVASPVAVTYTAGPAGPNQAICSRLVTVTTTSGPEVCNNGIDDDCDGQIDGADPDCAAGNITINVCPANTTVNLGDPLSSIPQLTTGMITNTCGGSLSITNDADQQFPGSNFDTDGVFDITWAVTSSACVSIVRECQQTVTVNPTSGGGCTWDEALKRIAADGTATDNYGISVDIDGDWAVVGAHWEDDGPANNNRGAVYIYRRIAANNWNFERKITPADGLLQDLFGESVAIIANGGDPVVVAGARWHDNSVASSQQGAVYVYRKNRGGTDNWGQVKKLVASDATTGDEFGASVDIDGEVIVVGAPNEDNGGFSNNGAVYFFVRDQGGSENWGQSAQRRANDPATNDMFGASVGYTHISGSEGYAIVGARMNDQLGAESGGAYIFRRSTGFLQMQKLTALDAAAGDQFGVSVGIDGTTAVVGSYLDNDLGLQSGAAYVYDLLGGSWSFTEKLTASDGAAYDQFGYAVDVDGNNVIVGARYDNTREGSFYLYNRNNGGSDAWGEVIRRDPSDGGTFDQFATCLAISGSTVIVGAPKHNIGANNDQGAVYFFDAGCPDPQARPSGGIQVADRAQPKSEILDFTGGFAARCFPNPFSELLNIELIVEEETEARISVSDATGRVVSQVYNGLATPGQRFQWDAADFPTGLYFVRIEAGANRKVVPVSMVK